MIPEIIKKQFDSLKKFEINSPLRLSHFLAQCSHESAHFTKYVENLNYSAAGLRKIFPKYFSTDLIALAYERKPEKIANKVYANRMGNGDEASGDGWKFRGRGAIQCTGRFNYSAFGTSINQDLIAHPEAVAIEYPLLSAAWFFHVNGINKIADLGATEDVIKQVTKKVNGGYIGIEDRIKLFNEYYKELK